MDSIAVLINSILSLGATETLLDLNKLNRDQQHEDMGIIEETAVLKQPLDLEKIQRNNVQNKNELIEEPPKEYDEQELPGPQDKRGLF